ncbi:MAG: hypothetical protein ACTSXH_15890 [Promethearchaeota archaeon]
MNKSTFSFLFLLFFVTLLSLSAKNISLLESRTLAASFEENDRGNCCLLPLDLSLNFDLFDKFNFGISVSHFIDYKSGKVFYKSDNTFYCGFYYEQYYIPLFFEWKIKIFKNFHLLPLVKIGINLYSYKDYRGDDGNIYTKEDDVYKLYKENQYDFYKLFFCISAGVMIKYHIPSTNLSIGLKGEISYPFSWESTKYTLTTGTFIELNILK